LSELADASAWAWSRKAGSRHLRHEFDSAPVDGDLATCDMVRLELLSSARNAGEFAEIREELPALPNCPIGQPAWERALWVYERLGARGGGHQRAVKHPDLPIAAAAEVAGVAVLHYDEDDAPRLARLRAGSRLRLPDCCVLLAARDAAAAGVATFDARLAEQAERLGLGARGS